MPIDWAADLVATHGVVTSALVLAFTMSFIKFAVFRPLGAPDIAVGVCDFAAVLSATSCSLLIAAMYLPTAQPKLFSVYIMLSVVVFLFNVGVLRYVEQNKFALSTHLKGVFFWGLASYAGCIFVSVWAAVAAYKGAGS